MKKNVLNLVCLTTMALATFTSCKKESTTPAVPLTTTSKTNFVSDPAINNNHFAFFSLERNEAVAVSDSATNKWDIAIRSTTILTNGGTSGPALGGAFVQRAVSFDTYATISKDSTFRTDLNTTPAYAIPTGSGNGWYNYNATTNIISPIPGNIIIVRTATGKFAKLEILSYYKDAPTTPTPTDVSRYYTFRFIYQPNGTKSF
jgi:HmuY protein